MHTGFLASEEFFDTSLDQAFSETISAAEDLVQCSECRLAFPSTGDGGLREHFERFDEQGKAKTYDADRVLMEQGSRAMIIDQGKVKADGKPEELRAKDPDSGTFTVTISGLPGSGIRSELEKLSGASSVAEIKATDVSLHARITPSKSGGGQLGEQIFKLCQERNLTLQELAAEQGRLDNMFHALTMPDTAPAPAAVAVSTTPEEPSETESSDDEAS